MRRRIISLNAITLLVLLFVTLFAGVGCTTYTVDDKPIVDSQGYFSGAEVSVKNVSRSECIFLVEIEFHDANHKGLAEDSVRFENVATGETRNITFHCDIKGATGYNLHVKQSE